MNNTVKFGVCVLLFLLFLGSTIRVTQPKIITIDPWVDVRSYWPRGTSSPGTAASDSTAFVRAFAKVASGGTVFIPDGTWDLSGFNISLTKPVRFVGQSRNGVVLQGDSTQNGWGGSGNQFVVKDECHFENITFQHWDTPIRLKPDSDGDIDGFTVVNCKFDSISHRSIAFNAGAGDDFHVYNVTIKDNIFNKVDHGIYLNGPVSHVSIESNNFFDLYKRKSSSSTAILVGDNGFAADNNGFIQVIGNSADSIQANSGDTHFILLYGHHMNIIGNSVTYVNNSVDSSDSEGIYWKGSYVNCTNNTLIDAGQFQGGIACKNEASDHVTISHNKIVYNNQKTNYAIYNNAINAVITHNEIDFKGSSAILHSGHIFSVNTTRTECWDISHNILKADTCDGIYPIYASATGGTVKMQDNMIECADSVVYAMRATSADSVFVDGNEINVDDGGGLLVTLSDYLSVSNDVCVYDAVTGSASYDVSAETIDFNNVSIEDATTSTLPLIRYNADSAFFNDVRLYIHGDVYSALHANATDSASTFIDGMRVVVQEDASDDLSLGIRLARAAHIVSIKDVLFMSNSAADINNGINIEDNIHQFNCTGCYFSTGTDNAINIVTGKTVSNAYVENNLSQVSGNFYNNIANVTVTSGMLMENRIYSAGGDSLGIVYYNLVDSVKDTAWAQ